MTYSRSPAWQWSSGTPYTFSDWSDHIGVEVSGSKFTLWTQNLKDIYRKIQPYPDQNLDCTTAFLASPFNPKWLRIPCSVSLANVIVICEDNDTVSSGTISRKRSAIECPNAWLKSNIFCLRIEQLNVTEWQKMSITKEKILCDMGDGTGLGTKTLPFHLSFFHQWSGNSQQKLILTITGYPNCTLLPSDMDGSIGGYSAVVEGPCEELVSQAHSFLCYTLAFSIDLEVCLPGHYQCESGTCILNAYRCDGVGHCEDNSDETNCTNACYALDHHTRTFECYVNCSKPFCLCSDHYYQCKVGGCVSWTTVCDCEDNCADGSDEVSCPDYTCTTPLYRYHSEFEVGTFHCNVHQSILVSLVGDKIPDCLDNLVDEALYINISTGLQQEENTRCEIFGDIPCQNGLPRCFPRDQLCIFDRHDPAVMKSCRSGEHLRNCFDFECPRHFKCPHSFCVPFYLACDGRYDCPDGEDELDCDASCPGLLKCASDGLCVHPSNIGDGSVDCKLSGDDDKGYQHFQCPSYCDCRGLSASCAGHFLLGPVLWKWSLNSLNYSGSFYKLTAGSIKKRYQKFYDINSPFQSVVLLHKQ